MPNDNDNIIMLVLILFLILLTCYMSIHLPNIINWFKSATNWVYQFSSFWEV